MRVLAVLAHPSTDSFAAQLHAKAVDTLKAGGHEVRVCDLYRDGFGATLSEFEWRQNQEVPRNREPVETYVADLEWAEALVLAFPTWWSAPPAILKGWLDRVFLPGVAFEMTEGPIGPLLTRLKWWVTITTCGSSRLQALVLGDPVRVLMRALRLAVAPNARGLFLRLHRMDTTTPAERERFLATVGRRLGRL